MKDTMLDLAGNGSERVPYPDPSFPVYVGERGLLPGGWGVVAHWHWDLELTVVLEGEIGYQAGSDTVLLRPGDVIFVNSGVLHRNFVPDGFEGNYRCILFHPDLLRTAFPETERILRLLTDRDDLPSRIIRAGMPRADEIARETQRFANAVRTEGKTLDVFAAVFGIVSLLTSDLKPRRTGSNLSNRMHTIRAMVGCIQSRYREPITLKEICEAGGVGPTTATELFRRYLDITPRKYLNDYRLQKAAELLSRAEGTIAAIAEATGFSGAGWFAERFRERYGITPGDYRKRALTPKNTEEKGEEGV